MGGLQSTERSLSVTASKGLSALRAAPDLCCAVNQRLTSVVREIRTLRSVGAGGSAPGDPVLRGKFLRSTHQGFWAPMCPDVLAHCMVRWASTVLRLCGFSHRSEEHTSELQSL